MKDDERTALREPASAQPAAEHSPAPLRPARRRIRDVVASGEVIAALIVGALTVASTIAGAVATNWLEVRQTVTEKSSSELSDDVDRLQRQLAASEDEADALRGQVAVLEEENARLGAGSEVPADASSDTTVPSASTGVLREESAVGIAPGYCLDLDSGAADWGLSSDASELYYALDGQDLCFRDDLLELHSMTVVDAEPMKSDCESETLVVDSIASRDLRGGQWVCGVTDQGGITAVFAEATDDNLTLHLRVWQ
ncbi:hypothetical protein [Myceligenerans crystallogenes]|uniref:Uncharacterized protein n=1 Tax=Myceligenerans crystallogenes TaxID=316335 RepID=A0ABP4ZM94_9MICO